MYFNFKYFKINDDITGYMILSEDDLIFTPKRQEELNFIIKNDNKIKAIDLKIKEFLRLANKNDGIIINDFKIKCTGEA